MTKWFENCAESKEVEGDEIHQGGEKEMCMPEVYVFPCDMLWTSFFLYVVAWSYNIYMTVVGSSDPGENMLIYLGTKYSKLQL